MESICKTHENRVIALFQALSSPFLHEKLASHITLSNSSSIQDLENDTDKLAHSVSTFDLADKFVEIQGLANDVSAFSKESQLKLSRSIHFWIKQVDNSELCNRYCADVQSLSIRLFKNVECPSGKAYALDGLSEMFSKIRSYTNSLYNTENDRDVIAENLSDNLKVDISSTHELISSIIFSTKKHSNSVLISLANLIDSLFDYDSADSTAWLQYLKFLFALIKDQAKNTSTTVWSVCAVSVHALTTLNGRCISSHDVFRKSGKELLLNLSNLLAKARKTNLLVPVEAHQHSRIKMKSPSNRPKRPNYRMINSVSNFIIHCFNFLSEFGYETFGESLYVEPYLSNILECICMSVWARSRLLNQSAFQLMENMCRNFGERLSSQEELHFEPDQRKHAVTRHLACLMQILSDPRSRTSHHSFALLCYGLISPAWLSPSDSACDSISLDGTQQVIEHSQLVQDLLSRLLKISEAASEDNDNYYDDTLSRTHCALSRIETLIALVKNSPKRLDSVVYPKFEKIFFRECRCLLKLPIEMKDKEILGKYCCEAIDMLESRNLNFECEFFVWQILNENLMSLDTYKYISIHSPNILVKVILQEIHSSLENIIHHQSIELANQLTKYIEILELFEDSEFAEIDSSATFVLLQSWFFEMNYNFDISCSLLRLIAVVIKQNHEIDASLLDSIINDIILDRLANWHTSVLNDEELIYLLACFLSLPAVNGSCGKTQYVVERLFDMINAVNGEPFRIKLIQISISSFSKWLNSLKELEGAIATYLDKLRRRYWKQMKMFDELLRQFAALISRFYGIDSFSFEKHINEEINSQELSFWSHLKVSPLLALNRMTDDMKTKEKMFQLRELSTNSNAHVATKSAYLFSKVTSAECIDENFCETIAGIDLTNTSFYFQFICEFLEKLNPNLSRFFLEKLFNNSKFPVNIMKPILDRYPQLFTFKLELPLDSAVSLYFTEDVELFESSITKYSNLICLLENGCRFSRNISSSSNSCLVGFSIKSLLQPLNFPGFRFKLAVSLVRFMKSITENEVCINILGSHFSDRPKQSMVDLMIFRLFAESFTWNHLAIDDSPSNDASSWQLLPSSKFSLENQIRMSLSSWSVLLKFIDANFLYRKNFKLPLGAYCKQIIDGRSEKLAEALSGHLESMPTSSMCRFLIRLFNSYYMANNYSLQSMKLLPSALVDLLANLCNQTKLINPENDAAELIIILLASLARCHYVIEPGVDVTALSKIVLWLSAFVRNLCKLSTSSHEMGARNFLDTLPLFGKNLSSIDTGPLRISLNLLLDSSQVQLSAETVHNPESLLAALATGESLIVVQTSSPWFIQETSNFLVANCQYKMQNFLDKAVVLVSRLTTCQEKSTPILCLSYIYSALAFSKTSDSPKLWNNTSEECAYFTRALISFSESTSDCLLGYLEKHGSELNANVVSLISTAANYSEPGTMLKQCHVVNQGYVAMATLMAALEANRTRAAVPDSSYRGLAMQLYDMRSKFKCPDSCVATEVVDLFVNIQQRCFALLATIICLKKPGAIEKILLTESDGFWKVLIDFDTPTQSAYFSPAQFTLSDEEESDSTLKIRSHPIFNAFRMAIDNFPKAKQTAMPTWLQSILNGISSDEAGRTNLFFIFLLIDSLNSITNYLDEIFETLSKVLISSNRFVADSEMQINRFEIELLSAIVKCSQNLKQLPHYNEMLVEQITLAYAVKVSKFVKFGEQSEESSILSPVSKATVRRISLEVVESVIQALKVWKRLIPMNRCVPDQFFDLIESSTKSRSSNCCYLMVRFVIALLDTGYSVKSRNDIADLLSALLNPPATLVSNQKQAGNVDRPILGFVSYILPYHLAFYCSKKLGICIESMLIEGLSNWQKVKPEVLAEILLFLSDVQDESLNQLISDKFLTFSLSMSNFQSNQAKSCCLEFAACISSSANQVVPRALDLMRQLPRPSEASPELTIWGHLLCACLESCLPKDNTSSYILSDENAKLLVNLDYALKAAVSSNCVEIRQIAFKFVNHLIAEELKSSSNITGSSSLGLKALADPDDFIYLNSMTFFRKAASNSGESNLLNTITRLISSVCIEMGLVNKPHLILPFLLNCLRLEDLDLEFNRSKIGLRLTEIHFKSQQINSQFPSTMVLKRWNVQTNSISKCCSFEQSKLCRDEFEAGADLWESLIREVKDDNVLKFTLSNSLDSLLRAVREKPRSENLIGWTFRLMFKAQLPIVDPFVVMNCGITSGHHQAAAALLEASFSSLLLPCDLVQLSNSSKKEDLAIISLQSKRSRMEEYPRDETPTSSQLTDFQLGSLIRIYRAFGDFDTARGIASRILHGSDSKWAETLMAALELESQSNWMSALEEYESAANTMSRNSDILMTNTDSGGSDPCCLDDYWKSELILSGQMQCLARLGEWEKLAEITEVLTETSRNTLESSASLMEYVESDIISNSAPSITNESIKYFVASKALKMALERNDKEIKQIDSLWKLITSSHLASAWCAVPLANCYSLLGLKTRANQILTLVSVSLLHTFDQQSLDHLKIIRLVKDCAIPNLSLQTDQAVWNEAVSIGHTRFESTQRINFEIARCRSLINKGAFDLTLKTLESIYRPNLRLIKSNPRVFLNFTLTYAECHLAPLRIESILNQSPEVIVEKMPKIAKDIWKVNSVLTEDYSAQFYRLLARTILVSSRIRDDRCRLNALGSIVNVIDSTSTPFQVGIDLLEKCLQTSNEKLQDSLSLFRFAISESQVEDSTLRAVTAKYLQSLIDSCSQLNLTNTCLYLPILLNFDRLYDFDEFVDGFDTLVSCCLHCADVVGRWLPMLIENSVSKFPKIFPTLQKFCRQFPDYAAFVLSYYKDERLWGIVESLAPATCSFIENGLADLSEESVRYLATKSPEHSNNWFVVNQSTSFKLPWLSHPVVSVDLSSFSILTSLRRPIRFDLRLENGSLARVLLKGDDDLKQDSAIELMLRTFAALLTSSGCSLGSRLADSCYAVAAISKVLGLVEWRLGATPLADFIEPTKFRCQADKLVSDLSGVKFELAEYTRLAATTSLERLVLVQEKRERLLDITKLRRSIVFQQDDALSAHKLRIDLIDSYAISCLSQYLLGVGDRHPRNVLIAGSDFVGCDFGYCYGMATSHLAVPELVPFRLTIQLQSLIWPSMARFQTSLSKIISTLLQAASIDSMDAAASTQTPQSFSISDRLRKRPLEVQKDLLATNKHLAKITYNNLSGVDIWKSFLTQAACLGKTELNLSSPGQSGDEAISARLSAIKEEPASVIATLPISSLATLENIKEEDNDNNCDIHTSDMVSPDWLARDLIALATNKSILALSYSGWQSYA